MLHKHIIDGFHIRRIPGSTRFTAWYQLLTRDAEPEPRPPESSHFARSGRKSQYIGAAGTGSLLGAGAGLVPWLEPAQDRFPGSWRLSKFVWLRIPVPTLTRFLDGGEPVGTRGLAFIAHFLNINCQPTAQQLFTITSTANLPPMRQNRPFSIGSSIIHHLPPPRITV